MRVSFLKKGAVQREFPVFPFSGFPDAHRRTDAVQPVILYTLCSCQNVPFSSWTSTVHTLSMTWRYSNMDRIVRERVIIPVQTPIAARSKLPQSSTTRLPSAQEASLCLRHADLSDSMSQFVGLWFTYSHRQTSTISTTSLLTLRETQWR